MKVPVPSQEKVFATSWQPMQQRLGKSLTEYIRHFLMRSGRQVKQSDVYFTLKQAVEERPDENILGYLKEVAAYAELYSRLLDPTKEKSKKLGERLTRLNRFEATTT